MVKQNFLTRMLLLFALIVGSTSVWGQDVTYDFTSGWTVSNGTLSNGTVSFTGAAAGNKGSFKMNGGYFMMGKSGAYINFPTYESAVSKIVVTGNSNASKSTKMNIYVGETAVSTETTGSTSTNTYEIAEAYQAAGTQYTLKVTSDHNAQITKIEVYYATGGGTIEDKVATPTFTPKAGTYPSAQTVAISCSTDGATIHYTTNGAEPKEEDDVYSSPISVTISGTVIKAKAFKEGLDASTVASATYTIKPNSPTIAISGANVTITANEECTIYYTTDNSTPSNSSTKYTAPFEQTTDCTIKAIAYDKYNNASETASAKFKYMPLSPKNINSNYYEKVTDVSTLENGDAILIVCEEDKVAMSSVQNSNNRGQADVTISEGIIDNPSSNVQKIVLVKQNEEINETNTDVFYFYTGSGYLYAASSSSNHLKTEASPDEDNNARATISISSGNATILFTGKNDRNCLKHNGITNGNLFSCYVSNSDMHVVQIYKEVAAPPVPASITSAGYATFSSDKNVDFDISANEGLTVYTAKDNGKSVTLYEVPSKKVPANTAVVLKGKEGDYTGTVVASADALTNNDLKVATEDLNGDGTIYVLNNVNGTVGFYKLSTTGTLSKGKAYLKSEGLAPFLGFDGEDTTGINSVERESLSVEGCYTLDGRHVAQPTKGLYIVNGKKVIIK